MEQAVQGPHRRRGRARWQQVRLRERMDWLYNYDATAIAF
jgi:hypothetical protein